MVNIAIAGGTGDVASEIIDVLLAKDKHNILILTRRTPPLSSQPRITYAQTDYADVGAITEILRGYSVVLSFVSAHLDQNDAVNAQRTLIDACIAAGVPRFAPSEWVTSTISHMPWYSFKIETREYLQEVNKESKVLEYCLFQPGLFTNYLIGKHDDSKHLTMLELPWDLEKGRILMRKGGEGDYLVWTTIKDLTEVVARAVEYEGEWPVIGGIEGTRLTMEGLTRLGEKITGKRFSVEQLDHDELETAEFASSWLPEVKHPAIAPEHIKAASKSMIGGLLLAAGDGAFDVSDEWNKLLPDYKFEGVETMLKKAWSKAD